MYDNSWRPIYTVDGRVVPDPLRLYPTPQGMAEPSPVRCRNGHHLGANRVLVGSTPCPLIGGHHRTHTCRTCGYVIYTPQEVPGCKH
ncbi:hypothetical protein [Nocardia sp. CA-290969]|uniref:hypothetical protein n=1 Tax=Nocardia sp. CA-290969 TaxID=3239986 RepID=UPI003D8A36CB